MRICQRTSTPRSHACMPRAGRHTMHSPQMTCLFGKTAFYPTNFKRFTHRFRVPTDLCVLPTDFKNPQISCVLPTDLKNPQISCDLPTDFKNPQISCVLPTDFKNTLF